MNEKTVLEAKEISLFKTSIDDNHDIEKIKDLLNIIVGKNNWNFDLEDKDNLLRISANKSINSFLTQEVCKLGFECIEIF